MCEGPSDVLSESDDDNVGRESYTDFENKTARKINNTVCYLSRDSGSEKYL
jgi:hypothetical protein